MVTALTDERAGGSTLVTSGVGCGEWFGVTLERLQSEISVLDHLVIMALVARFVRFVVGRIGR